MLDAVAAAAISAHMTKASPEYSRHISKPPAATEQFVDTPQVNNRQWHRDCANNPSYLYSINPHAAEITNGLHQDFGCE